MKRFSAMLVVLFLAGCGAETVGVAATAAAAKKQELEQGRKTLENVQQQLDQANQQTQKRNEQLNEGK